MHAKVNIWVAVLAVATGIMALFARMNRVTAL
jgi:hypothetical protein